MFLDVINFIYNKQCYAQTIVMYSECSFINNTQLKISKVFLFKPGVSKVRPAELFYPALHFEFGAVFTLNRSRISVFFSQNHGDL